MKNLGKIGADPNGTTQSVKIGQKLTAGIAMLWPVGLMATVWTLVFFVW